MTIPRFLQRAAIGLALVIGFIIFALVIYYFAAIEISSYHGARNTNFMAKQFIQIASKSDVTVSGKNCINNNVDTPDYCSFTVQSKGSDSKTASDNLTNTLRDAGYLVSTSPNQAVAINKTLNLEITISAQNTNVTDVIVSRASQPYQ